MGNSNCMGASYGRNKNRKKRKIPTEEQLNTIAGRIYNNANASRSCSASLFTQQGRKGINQDAMILWEGFGSDDTEVDARVVLCGVFDGHGPHGHLVARKVRDVLPLKLMAAMGDLSPMNENRNDVALVAACRKAFTRAYKAMDKDLRSHPTVDCFCSGSTAVTLLKLDSNLFIGNIGDSRAVLATKDSSGAALLAVQLTVDLKPDLPREAERISKCRGRVFALEDEPEVPRVWLPFDNAPGLAMARAFGDFCLKNYGVISVPEFFHWPLTDRDQFVILASDGVWDVLSNQEAVDIVSSSPSRAAAAKLVIEAATREWKTTYPTSKIDDCAVVCLYFDGTVDHENDSAEINIDDCSQEDYCTAEPSEGQPDEEPTLTRNFTVRSGGNTRLQLHPITGEDGSPLAAAAQDQNWSGLDGVTRVNSIVHLPRFPEQSSTTT